MLLDNLRSAHNVGSVMRTARALDYAAVHLCGVTLHPPSTKLRETSRGVEEELNWQAHRESRVALGQLRSEGWTAVALESGRPATLEWDQVRAIPRLLWVIGNEAQGISQTVLDGCDHVLALPMPSGQASINVACAFSAAAYHDHLGG